MPGSRTVPWYRPNTCTTVASPATTEITPWTMMYAATISSTPSAILPARSPPGPDQEISTSSPAMNIAAWIRIPSAGCADQAGRSLSGHRAVFTAVLTGACTLIATTSVRHR